MTDTVDPPIDKRPICYQDFCDMAAYMRCSEYDGQSMSAKDRFVISLRSLRNAVMNDDLIKQSMEPAALEMVKMVFVQGANWLATHPNEKAEVYDVERTKREVAVHSLASALTKAIYGKEFTSLTSSTTISKTAQQEFFRTLCVSKVPWRGSIQIFDKANTGSVSMDQMAQVFEDWNVKLTDQGKEFISSFAGGDQLIKYQALCDGIYKCDFDDTEG
eukprot:FR737591.1.p1 GENE.FR737591.1~~FR737591.1.p1  ORF type:complete len:226 (+),score=19.79 FR737591.1:28-678(+)